MQSEQGASACLSRKNCTVDCSAKPAERWGGAAAPAESYAAAVVGQNWVLPAFPMDNLGMGWIAEWWNPGSGPCFLSA